MNKLGHHVSEQFSALYSTPSAVRIVKVGGGGVQWAGRQRTVKEMLGGAS
jgi:hypothetical protein